MTTNDKLHIWIEAGYLLFWQDGPNGLKVEALSRMVNKSKSSFYHHFADLEVFTDHLLTYHLRRGKTIAAQASLCQNMIPDMINLLLEVKEDILFNRQLRIHRRIPKYKACCEQSHEPVETAFLGIWAKAIGLAEQQHLARMMLSLTVENFYLRVTRDNLSYEWLLEYMQEIQFMVDKMRSK